MAETQGIRGDGPIVMADVVRELQALADIAARHDAGELVLAARRMQSLLERLRNQFVFDVVGSTPAGNVPIPIDRYRPAPIEDADTSIAATGTTP